MSLSKQEQYEKLARLTETAQKAFDAAATYAETNNLPFSKFMETTSANEEWENSWQSSSASC